MSDKSKLESDLAAMTPEQFAKIAETVEAERTKRDAGASEREFARKVANMTNNEFEQFKREQGLH